MHSHATPTDERSPSGQTANAPPAETQLMPADSSASVLFRVLDGYLAELQAGRQPDRERLLAEHPEIAAHLEQCLAGIEFIHHAAGPVAGAPTRLGDFQILSEVGRGGMGVVYEALQVSLKRRVALKVLRYGAASDAEAMQRFQREAETVAGLHHTNIVPIFAIGCEGGVHYYAMQFIEGQSLADRLHAENHDSHEIAGWGLQAAEALAHAHRRGVVHRDIKPSNLILDADGRIWLTDFGLAKRLDDVTLSLAGAVLGTPRYMSPEQAAAAQQPVDHRTDIYSLGATLYELSTGRPLFDAETPYAVISQILTAEPPAPRSVRASLPRDLETIILKCLAKEQTRRYQSAQELADDLRAFVEGRAIRARRATAVERAARWLKHQQRSVVRTGMMIAATVALLAGGTVVWSIYSQSQRSQLMLETPRDSSARAEVAEILDGQGELVVPPFTLPTTAPVSLPAGGYRVRLSAPGRLSTTYLVDTAPGREHKYSVAMDDEDVAPPIRVQSPEAYELVQIEGQTRVLVWTGDGSTLTLHCIAPAAVADRVTQERPAANEGGGPSSAPPALADSPAVRDQIVWQADWRPDSPASVALVTSPDERDRWRSISNWWAASLAQGSPARLLRPAGDLDGNLDVLVWYSPTAIPDPGLVAASSADGKLRWWFRSMESSGAAGRLIGAPVWTKGRVDAEGSADLIVGLYRSDGEIRRETWLEAVAAGDGEPQWRQALDSVEAGIQHRGEPKGIALCQRNGRSTILCLSGSWLYGFDAATGRPTWPPHDLGSMPREIRLADVDGDGGDELVAVHEDAAAVFVSVVSLKQLKLLWRHELSIDRYRLQFAKDDADWPLVVDLEGDNRAEVIVPFESGPNKPAWQGVEVLNGADGSERWRRKFPLTFGWASQQHPGSARYFGGPDVDGDGNREVYMACVRRELTWRQTPGLASIRSEGNFLFVDCFSGRDGHSVWWNSLPLGRDDSYALTATPGPPVWWSSGIDGSPRLGLPLLLRPEWRNEGGTHSLHVLDAATGRVVRSGENIAFPRLADVNDDGLSDLAVYVPDDPSGFNFDPWRKRQGRLHFWRGSPPEAFRRLGNWQPAQDFDGDGIPELIDTGEHVHVDAITVASGRDGRITRTWPVDWVDGLSRFNAFPPRLGDLDGDSTADLIGHAPSSLVESSNVPGAPDPLLLQAISGRTGRPLWLAGPVPRPDWTQPAATVQPNEPPWSSAWQSYLWPNHVRPCDVDGDGRPEVLCELHWEGGKWIDREQSGQIRRNQHHLALLDGRTGAVRWIEAYCDLISDRLEAFGTENEMRICDPVDLNGDGVGDIVLLGLARSEQGWWTATLQARDGRTGQLLWPPQPLTEPKNNKAGFAQPLIGDLDGDGRSEIIMLESNLLVTVRRGDTGDELWEWQIGTNNSDTNASVVLIGRGQPDAAEPPPAGMGKRELLVAVGFFEIGPSAEIALIDAAGHVIERAPTGRLLWAFDLDGDGTNELVRPTEAGLQATRGGIRNVLWTWKPPASLAPTVQFQRTAEGRTLVIVTSDAEGFLLDGSTGRPMWRGRVADNSWQTQASLPAALAGVSLAANTDRPQYLDGAGREWPLGGHRAARQFLPVQPDGRYSAQPIFLDATNHSRTARLGRPSGLPVYPIDDDPRLTRPLPWVPHKDEWTVARHKAAANVLTALALSLLVVIVPLSLMRPAFRRGKPWWIRLVRIIGGVGFGAGVFALYRAAPPGLEYLPSHAVLAIAFGAVPFLVWPAALLKLLLATRWKRLAWFIVATLLMAVALAAFQLAMLGDHLDETQHYSWSGWWLILPMGAYFVGVLLALGRVFGPPANWIRRRCGRS